MRIARYAWAPATVLVAFIVYGLFGPHLVFVPFMLFVAATAVTAVKGGRGPAVLAVALAALLADYFLLPPGRSLMLSPPAFASTVAFAFTCAIIIQLVAAYRREEEGRRAEEAKFRVAQEHALDGFAVLRAARDRTQGLVDFEWEYLNPAAVRILGGEGFVGRRYRDTRQDSPEARAAFAQCAAVLETGARETWEAAIVTANRERAWHRLTATKLGDGVAVTFTDISVQKRAEQALGRSEDRFQVAQDLSLDAFTLLKAIRDDAGRIVDFEWEYVNPVAAQYLRRNDLVGKRLNEVLPGNRENKHLFERYVRVVETGEANEVELFYDADGITGWFRNASVKMGDSVAVSFRDISESQRLLDALRESEERFRVMADGLPHLIWVTGADGGIQFVNRAYCEFFGVCVEQVEGANWQPLVHPDDAAGYVGAFLESLRVQGYFHAQARVRRADGEWRWVESLGAPRFSPSGDFLGVVGSSPDITERMQSEQALRESEARLKALNEELEQRVQERTAELVASYEAQRRSERLAAIGQMVAGLSHESRNALQNSLAALEILGKRLQDQPGVLRLVEQVRKSQLDLQRIYDEVREYAAPVVLERTEVSLDDVWREAWADLGPQREGRTAVLTESCNGTDLRCTVDPHRLKRVFRNLLENSLAACPDPVEVHVRCRQADPSEGAALRVSVRDNGPGIAPEQARHVFEPFYTTKSKGTGLGMAIVRRLVEEHGGRVEIAAPGSPGFEVVIELPREPAARP